MAKTKAETWLTVGGRQVPVLRGSARHGLQLSELEAARRQADSRADAEISKLRAVGERIRRWRDG